MKDLDLHEITRLRELKWSWNKIACLLGCDPDTVRCRIDPEFAERQSAWWKERSQARRDLEKTFSTSGLNLGLGNGARPSQDALLERDHRLSQPYRDLTGQFLGDPRIGESALDRKMVSA